MDEYLSERQQMDQVWAWIRENAPWAAAGILIAVGGLVGVQQWDGWRQRQAVTANAKYTGTLEALAKSDAAGAATIVKELRDSYSRTPYADLAALALARYDVEAGKLADAAHYFDDVIANSRDADLKNIARLRLARVQRADGKPDLALATLASATPGAGAAAFADVRGDVLLDKGDKAGALAAWREALAAKTPGLVNRELLELKIATLGAAPGSAPAAAAVTGAKP